MKVERRKLDLPQSIKNLAKWLDERGHEDMAARWYANADAAKAKDERIAELEADNLTLNGTLSMAVDRLGGTVEGLPTGKHNFLQRIDELIEKEKQLAEPGQHSEHWTNPETGQIECECCCKWALDMIELKDQFDKANTAAREVIKYLSELCELEKIGQPTAESFNNPIIANWIKESE